MSKFSLEIVLSNFSTTLNIVWYEIKNRNAAPGLYEHSNIQREQTNI